MNLYNPYYLFHQIPQKNQNGTKIQNDSIKQIEVKYSSLEIAKVSQ